MNTRRVFLGYLGSLLAAPFVPKIPSVSPKKASFAAEVIAIGLSPTDDPLTFRIVLDDEDIQRMIREIRAKFVLDQITAAETRAAIALIQS